MLSQARPLAARLGVKPELQFARGDEAALAASLADFNRVTVEFVVKAPVDALANTAGKKSAGGYS
jgi:hypothetical protein